MLSSLAFFLLLETVEPTYVPFTALLPSQLMASSLTAAESPSLEIPNIPVKITDSLGPVMEAKSVFSIDLNTGSPLFSKAIFERRQIGSIEKLVTAMVILDNHRLDEKTIVSKNAASQEGSKMWLAPGEEITVENLLFGMLVNSGNDAAVALAEFDSGSEQQFVAKMNEKVRSMFLKDTHFTNAKGFDDPENYSTAYDTIVFSRAALSYPFIREKVKIKNAEVFSAKGGVRHKLESTNELLENPFFKVVGLKTGKTPAAGESFVSLAIGPNNHEILTVILDSPSRFKETKILLDWLTRNYEFP